MEKLKEKARRKSKQLHDRRKEQTQNRENMTAIPEGESDNEENIMAEQTKEQKIKQEHGEEKKTEYKKATTHEEMPKPEELQPRRDTVQEERRTTTQEHDNDIKQTFMDKTS